MRHFLLAASSSAFAFSRLATLDTVIVFEWAWLLWVASYAGSGRIWPLLALGMGAPHHGVNQDHGACPSCHQFYGFLWKKNLRAIPAVSVMAAAGNRHLPVYRLKIQIRRRLPLFLRYQRTGGRGIQGAPVLFCCNYFSTACGLTEFCTLPGLAALLLSLVWLRVLWKNPLFTASWIAFAGDAIYILRRQDDYAPRYFLVMLVPLILTLVITLQELKTRNRAVATLLAAALAVAVVLNTAQVVEFLTHRQYQFY